jgi:hypothetical protein
MLAYKINAADRKVEAIEINDWKDIAPAIGGECESFEAPVTLENDDTFYTDEEGLYHSCEGGWMLENFAHPMLGNAVVQGTDDEGGSTEPKSTIEEIEAMIIWVSKENCETYRNRAHNTPPRVYGF